MQNKAKEMAYTSVGIGILAFQKVQVRRRELAEEIDKEFPHAKAFVLKQVETTISNVAMVMTSLINSGCSRFSCSLASVAACTI